METKANYVLVGVFTLVILVLSFGFVWWSANVSDANSRVPLIVRIEGSVSGLSQGSQVLFNGLGIGAVTNLRIDPNDPRVVIATTQVDRTTPITQSTTATIGFQGLTGVGFIGLTGGKANERNIIESAMEQGATPVIRADPSDVTDILATARDIADRANNILGQFEEIVQVIGPSVRTTADNVAQTSGNIQTFTASLAANSDEVADFIGSLARLSDSADGVAKRLPGLIDQTSTFIGALDSDAVNRSVQNVAAITDTVREQSGTFVDAVGAVSNAVKGFGTLGESVQRNTPQIDRFLGNLGPLSDSAASVATRLDDTLGSAQRITAAVDPDRVRQTLDGVAGFTAALNSQSDRVGSIVAGTDTAIATLNTSLTGLNGTRARIDEILAGIDPADVTQAVASVSAASNDLASAARSANDVISQVDAQKIRQTLDNVAGFTGALNDQSGRVESIVAGTDTAISTLNTSLTGLNGTRARIDEILAGVDPADVTRAVNNVSAATTNIANAADSVNGLATSIGQRRDDINRIITNATEVSGNLRTATASANTLIGSVNDLVNSPDGKGLVTDVRSTLESIRDTATSIRSAVGPISSDIQKFSGQGLQEVRSLVQQSTRAVSSIQDAVTNLSDDPSRILFGGGSTGNVREFNGRTRR